MVLSSVIERSGLRGIMSQGLPLEKVRNMLDPNGYIYIEVPGIRFDGLVDPLKYFDSECNFYFDLKTIIGLLKKHNMDVVYADENMRILCGLGKSEDRNTMKCSTMSLARAKAYLFKHAVDVLEPHDSGLYNLLKKSESKNLRMRLFRKLRRMYFVAYYSSLTQKQKGRYEQV